VVGHLVHHGDHEVRGAARGIEHPELEQRCMRGLPVGLSAADARSARGRRSGGSPRASNHHAEHRPAVARRLACSMPGGIRGALPLLAEAVAQTTGAVKAPISPSTALPTKVRDALSERGRAGLWARPCRRPTARRRPADFMRQPPRIAIAQAHRVGAASDRLPSPMEAVRMPASRWVLGVNEWERRMRRVGPLALDVPKGGWPPEAWGSSPASSVAGSVHSARHRACWRASTRWASLRLLCGCRRWASRCCVGTPGDRRPRQHQRTQCHKHEYWRARRTALVAEAVGEKVARLGFAVDLHNGRRHRPARLRSDRPNRLRWPVQSKLPFGAFNTARGLSDSLRALQEWRRACADRCCRAER
jgi:hypothetical protein